jgi:hypothetical protein
MNDSIIDFFLLVCQKLETLKLPYMLTGSAAMNYYSVIRTTQDLDIVIEIQQNEVESFLAIFPNHYYHEPSIISEIRRQGMFNLIDFKTGYKIDFILRKNDEYSETAFSRRWLSNDFGHPIYVISLEDLILAKLLWIQQLYSDRQATDIKQLLQSDEVDRKYLKLWIEKLNIKIYEIAI